jgi:hypothetical protein
MVTPTDPKDREREMFLFPPLEGFHTFLLGNVLFIFGNPAAIIESKICNFTLFEADGELATQIK